MKKDIAQINGHLTRKPLQNTEIDNITNPREPILGKQYLLSLSFILNMICKFHSLRKFSLKKTKNEK